MEFYIPETQKTITAKQRPIVIITSNAEKELPSAFLRRCIFHYIEFPNEELMREIVKVHYPDLEENILSHVLEAFYWIRSLPDIQKKPSTSEVIDWIAAIQAAGVPYEKIRENYTVCRRSFKEKRRYRPYAQQAGLIRRFFCV